MNYVKLRYTGNSYFYDGGSSIEMDTLGIFLTDNEGCLGSSFKEWILNPTTECVGGNTVFLEKEGDYVFLEDEYSEEKVPTKLKIHQKELVKILGFWRDKVCKTMPQYVMIKHENDQYTIETSETPFG